jgi:integrase
MAKQLVKLWKRPSYDGERFTYYLLYADENGRRRQKSLRHADYRKAERQRAQLERELRMGIVEPGSMRLREFLEDSLIRTGDQIRESTRVEYRSAMEEFISVIGDVDYTIVRQMHGELFRQTCLDRENTPATVTKKLREIKRFFQLAIERQQLDVHPLKYVKVPRSPKKKIRIYSEDECDRILRAASQIQNNAILEWDILVTLAITTGMRKSELLNLTWADIDFEAQIVEVSPKESTAETWEWRIKDTDRRNLPLTQDVVKLLVNLQNGRLEGYPYVFVPPERYDHIQQKLRAMGNWTLSHARTTVINNFKRMFDRILAAASVKAGTFHDLRKTAITNWFYQGLNIYDVMRLAGHSKYETTYRFYLQVKDGLVDRARCAITHTVSQELLQKCCSRGSDGDKEKGQQA